MFEESLSSRSTLAPETLGLCKHIRKVNNYLLATKIGSGSSSTVYAAIDTTTHRHYAVKRIRISDLLRSANGVGQLEREVGLIRKLRHPNILQLVEVLHDDVASEVYLVLEYAKKGSLGGFVSRGQSLSHDAILAIIRQIALALKYLHGLGYVHQDIKPGNVLIDENGRAMLADFGIGHTFASAAMVVGSPAFQAPEALDDHYIDADVGEGSPQKEDVWALGVTLYQLLFLRLPYFGNNLYEVVSDILQRPLEIPADVEPEIADLLRGMLSVNPAQRFGIDDLLANPLLSTDRPYDLPPSPEPVMKDGPVVPCRAHPCAEGFSFASLAVHAPRRFSQKRFGEVPRKKIARAQTVIGRKPAPVIGSDSDSD
jgi:serine/threonine-protein kinase 11